MLLTLSSNTSSSLITSKAAGDTITASFADSTFKILTSVYSATFTQEQTPSIALSLEDQESLVFYINT